MTWSPTKILRIAEVLNSSTRPLVVETDQGFALAKYCGNPQGRDSLCSELVAAELLQILGIDAPAHEVIMFEGATLGQVPTPIPAGHAFLTEWQTTAITFSGSKGILEKTRNQEVITKLIVFDTWIKNFDRFIETGQTTTENLDNLLFVPEGTGLRMMVIDHSNAFTETTFEDGFPSDWWMDETVSGTHPNFATFVRDDVLHKTLDEIAAINEGQLEQIVSKIPPDWELSQSSKDKLVEGLPRRAAAMQEWLPVAILRQPPLNHEFGRMR